MWATAPSAVDVHRPNSVSGTRYVRDVCCAGSEVLVVDVSRLVLTGEDLLDGGELTKHWMTTGNWKLGKDGVVALEPRQGEKAWQRYDAYLWSKKQYKDFDVDFEYKVAKGGNRGFYFHVGDLKNPVAKGIASEQPRQNRGVMVLELIGSGASKNLLRKWASGLAGALLTMEASAALPRLAGPRLR